MLVHTDVVRRAFVVRGTEFLLGGKLRHFPSDAELSSNSLGTGQIVEFGKTWPHSCTAGLS